DRYGFKKSNQYISKAEYDAWNTNYTQYIERRRKKWYALMRAYGLMTDDPIRFPPKSEKVKRYVRKGIPPEWRGAAWFWYAGGPGRLARMQGVYWELVRRCEKPEDEGGLNDADREHIERDLHRTFPDNISFKPDPPTTPLSSPESSPESWPDPPDPPILNSLRRVLRAFALHNPQIGYCQSLNFIAGLLLLFLKSDEEKAFILLDVITSVHLPGTHARVLEANVDIGVLMDLLREHLPAVWNRIDDGDPADLNPAPGKRGAPGLGPAQPRLPTVSLATTPWFMSLFIGTLPIESTLRVWDSLFYEGSKTLFRVSLAIFKLGEPSIRAIEDPMEVFQVVQTLPRKMLDVNMLMEACWKRKGFGSVNQELIDERR
ncbi:RabGAP/TBC, partial [Eremomyces bilateralis CBS 781.70]